MRDLIQFIADYETVIYFVLGVSSLPIFYRLFEHWQDAREARFGLERESSQAKINRTVLSLFYLFVITVIVFVSVTFIKPNLPIEMGDGVDGGENIGEDGEIQEKPEAQVEGVMLPTVDFNASICEEETVNITSPEADEDVSGEISIEGTASIENFAFYKFEVTPVDDPLWITIQAGRSQIVEGVLVSNWNTSRFTPGNYYIRLVVTDSENEEYPACIIPIKISAPVEE